MERMEVRKGDGGERGIAENKLMEIKKKIEMREREERKKNILIKGLEVKNGRKREVVEEVVKMIEVKANMKEVKKLGEDKRKGGRCFRLN